MSVSITPMDNKIAGQNYSLKCSVNVTGSDNIPTLTWLDQMNNKRVMTNGDQSTSVLSLSSLSPSDVGVYTCRAVLGGAVVNETITLVREGEFLSNACMTRISSYLHVPLLELR